MFSRIKVMFSVACIFQLGYPNTKFWSIDVPMMSVLHYVTVLNRLFDDFAYFAVVFFMIGVDIRNL